LLRRPLDDVEDPAIDLQVADGGAPPGWDEDIRRAGGNVFHSEAWAAHRCHAGRAEPLYCTWWDARTGAVAGRALGIRRPPRHSRAGRLVAQVTFDTPPVGATDVDYVSALRTWARENRTVVAVSLGSFDARLEWSPSGPPEPEERCEFLRARADETELRAGMRQMTRRAIKRAEKLGLQARPTVEPAQLRAFADLYLTTLSRLEATKGVPAPVLDAESFAQSLRLLVDAGRGRLYMASDGGAPQAGCFFGVFHDSAFYIHNGAAEAARRSGATPLCLLAAMRDLSASGVLRINLGGVPADAGDPASPDHGLYEFKLGLGTEPVRRVGGTLVTRPLRARATGVAQRLLAR
jgi:Acetyltransferase (GNAT) domain